MTNASPADLANAVHSVLKKLAICPRLDVLTDLFSTMYFASLNAEETQMIAFEIVYLDPKNPDPSPPKRLRCDYWSFIPFSKPIQMTVPSLVQISQASDLRTSS